MKRLNKIIVAAAISCTVTCALGADPKVIANPNIKTDAISAEELKSLFLGEKISLADGTHIEPVLRKGGAVHEKFLRDYLGKNANDLQMYYQSLVFSGRASMPRELDSDAEVVAYVARTKGAIGYVSSETNSDRVKVLLVLNPRGAMQRKLITRVEPKYPETLQRLNIGGTVRLQVTISPKGNVEHVDILGGNPILAEAAIDAVKQWVYSPGPTETTTEVSIPFEQDH
jgi:TonB family protein